MRNRTRRLIRGGDPDLRADPARDYAADPAERALEQGLEETFPGSDAVSITQPHSKLDRRPKQQPVREEADS